MERISPTSHRIGVLCGIVPRGLGVKNRKSAQAERIMVAQPVAVDKWKSNESTRVMAITNAGQDARQRGEEEGRGLLHWMCRRSRLSGRQNSATHAGPRHGDVMSHPNDERGVRKIEVGLKWTEVARGAQGDQSTGPLSLVHRSWPASS